MPHSVCLHRGRRKQGPGEAANGAKACAGPAEVKGSAMRPANLWCAAISCFPCAHSMP